jgi:hypothetical protein
VPISPSISGGVLPPGPRYEEEGELVVFAESSLLALGKNMLPRWRSSCPNSEVPMVGTGRCCRWCMWWWRCELVVGFPPVDSGGTPYGTMSSCDDGGDGKGEDSAVSGVVLLVVGRHCPGEVELELFVVCLIRWRIVNLYR